MSISKEKDLKKLMNSIEGVTLKEAHGKKFHFPFYFTESMNQVSIEALELGVRASNALHRSGFHTIGELTEAMDSGFELKSVRSCGAQTVREIMESLFFYQYNQMSPERRKDYLVEVVIWNRARRAKTK